MGATRTRTPPRQAPSRLTLATPQQPAAAARTNSRSRGCFSRGSTAPPTYRCRVRFSRRGGVRGDGGAGRPCSLAGAQICPCSCLTMLLAARPEQTVRRCCSLGTIARLAALRCPLRFGLCALGTRDHASADKACGRCWVGGWVLRRSEMSRWLLGRRSGALWAHIHTRTLLARPVSARRARWPALSLLLLSRGLEGHHHHGLCQRGVLE